MSEVKLYKGDCVEVMKSLPSNSIDLIVTDPPYKLTSRGGSGTMSGYWAEDKAMKGLVFDSNDTDIEDYIDGFYRILKDGTHCYIMCNQLNLPHFLEVIGKSEFKYIKCLIWDKCNKICGRYYMNCFEYIIMLRKGGERTINDCGMPDILRVPNIKTLDKEGKNIHDSEKPIRLMQILIEQSTNEGEVVFEPFMGSGTTGIASVQSKRNFIGVEIDDKYFGLAEKRINNATQTLTLF